MIKQKAPCYAGFLSECDAHAAIWFFGAALFASACGSTPGADEGEETGVGFGLAPDGTLIESVAECTGVSAHALRRMQERGISISAITDALKNPLQIIPQANGNTLYVGASARVVLSPKGWMVTCM